MERRGELVGQVGPPSSPISPYAGTEGSAILFYHNFSDDHAFNALLQTVFNCSCLVMPYRWATPPFWVFLNIQLRANGTSNSSRIWRSLVIMLKLRMSLTPLFPPIPGWEKFLPAPVAFSLLLFLSLCCQGRCSTTTLQSIR